jgi:hypothetical protein
MRSRITRVPTRGSLAAILLALVLPMSAARAQVVVVQLREELSDAPLPGAIVRLLRDGEDVAQALTNSAGRALLRPPAPGTYAIRINRIGFQPMTTDSFRLARGQTMERELSMTAVRISLPTVVVASRGECDAGLADGSVAVALWEEIRNALTANVLTTRERNVSLHVSQFRRSVNPEGAIENEWVVSSRPWFGAPFASHPAATLAARGFVWEERNGSMTFAGPDAALFLSEAFISTHCFWAVPGEGDLIGLAFAPLPSREVADVRGTLWVRRSTSELASLDFTYTRLPSDLRPDDLGGRVEFRRLPSGAWIISYWHIRMPRLELVAAEFRAGGDRLLPRQARPARRTVVGFQDHGGRVELASEHAARRALVMGRIFDSTTAAGVAGAVVHVRGQGDSVLTDDTGRYLLSVAADGNQTLVASHPRLGLIGDGSTRTVHLTRDDSTIVDFAVPPLSTFASTMCGSRARAGLVGIAWGADGAPEEGLEIRVSWEPGYGVMREERAVSGRGGLYSVCDLPTGARLSIRVHRGSTASRGSVFAGGTVLMQTVVELKRREFRWLDLQPEGES